MREDHSENGLMMWLSSQFSGIQMTLGELRAHTAGNRQTLIESHRQLSHRMDRLEDRITRNGGNGRSKYSWIKHIPWNIIFKLMLLLIGATLLITGHLTIPETKAWLIR